jgi:hypothetical protein
MEFYKTKLFGGEVNVLFTEGNYFFFHKFHGLICIAERDFDVEYSNGTDTDNWVSKFVLYADDKWDIQKECFEIAKRIIRKYDQRFLKKQFQFREVIADLDKRHVKLLSITTT